jgi:hypothetical protein
MSREQNVTVGGPDLADVIARAEANVAEAEKNKPTENADPVENVTALLGEIRALSATELAALTAALGVGSSTSEEFDPRDVVNAIEGKPTKANAEAHKVAESITRFHGF